jgi:ABC-type sugar transport system ATPase subunit
MSAENILELRRITKDFPGVRAVNQVDFDLRYGEVHGLIGENGAGKSTLINILGGVLQPDAGEIVLEGAPIQFAGPADAACKGIAVVFQELSLVPTLSLAENIFFNRQPITPIGFVSASRLNSSAQQLLSLFKLQINPATPVKNLSMGYRQIIEVLKAISLRPKILILDEPNSSMCSAEKDHMFLNNGRLK